MEEAAQAAVTPVAVAAAGPVAAEADPVAVEAAAEVAENCPNAAMKKSDTSVSACLAQAEVVTEEAAEGRLPDRNRRHAFRSRSSKLSTSQLRRSTHGRRTGRLWASRPPSGRTPKSATSI